MNCPSFLSFLRGVGLWDDPDSDLQPNLDTLKILGEALAIGLLVGIERYRGREPGEKKSAGVRTFAIFCLLGAVCGLIGATAFTAVTFLAVDL